MNINNKAKEFASYIKSTDEYKNMNLCKNNVEKNRSLKKQLDTYISKKNNIYSKCKIDDANLKINQLNRSYSDFFKVNVVSEYMESTRVFNTMMENIYKVIKNELLK